MALAGGVSSACERPPVRVTVTDSAGVEVVTSEPVRVPLPVAFRVEPTPVLDLAMSTPDGPDLSTVVMGALLPGGELVVGDAGGALHRVGLDGQVRWSLAAAGALTLAAGPGDSVTALIEPGDSLVVLGPSGLGRRVGLVWTSAAPLGELFPVDGGFVALTGWSTRMLGESASAGLREDPAALVRFGESGALLDTLATPMGSQVGLVGIGGRLALAPPHFPRLTLLAAAGGRLFLGTGARDEVLELDPSGTRRRILRRAGRSLAIDDRDRAAARAFRQRLLGGNPLAAGLGAELDRALPMPERMPPYADLIADPDGRLWVGDYPDPGEAPSVWTVYGSDGGLLGTVTLPIRFHLLDVGGGRILGNVPGGASSTVRVYDLVTPEP